MTLEEMADAIADKANECCYRSDGYREEVRDLALAFLESAAASEFDPSITPLLNGPEYSIALSEALRTTSAFLKAKKGV